MVDAGRSFAWEGVRERPRATAEGGRGLHILHSAATQARLRAGELDLCFELKGDSHDSET